MSENYKFFQHKECEYFPCHKVKDDKDFNCLFCYCPLYFTDECEGNCRYIGKIKDCSNCMIPHSKNAYEYIVGKIIDINNKKNNEK